jgi:hypothetical protein
MKDKSNYQTVGPIRHLMNINVMLRLLVKIRFCDSIRNGKFHCVTVDFNLLLKLEEESGRIIKGKNVRVKG